MNGILTQTPSVPWKSPKLLANKQHTYHSPVSVLAVHAGSPIEARVSGVGRAGSVGHFPGSASAHRHGRHLYWHQGQGTRVHQAGRVTDAQLCETAAVRPTVCVHTLIYFHLAHVHAQQGLQLQRWTKNKSTARENTGERWAIYRNSYM